VALKRGFTLIEVLVVLSILAIVAVLAYNFFGSSMKEAKLTQATSKIYNDLRVLSDAAQVYEVKHGTLNTDLAGLVADGIIKAAPTPDPAVMAIPGGNYEYSYFAGDYLAPFGGDDDLVNLGGVNLEVCGAYNEKHCPNCTEGADANQWFFDQHAAAEYTPDLAAPYLQTFCTADSVNEYGMVMMPVTRR